MDKYPRNGTDVDASAILTLFQEMGFITEDHHNLSVYEMRKVFKAAAKRDYSGASCFCCCVLSHGQEGVIYGTDGTIDIREMTSFFHGTNLSGKPKLFFFQACQGELLFVCCYYFLIGNTLSPSIFMMLVDTSDKLSYL